ncbi:MAG: beta-ketoacyl-ACP synthase [Microcoleaceae cyanobacterium]
MTLKSVVVTGIGLVCALGRLKSSWQKLTQGKSGINQQQPFSAFHPQPLGLMKAQPTTINQIIPILVTDALTDAGLTPPLADFGVVVGSSRGYQAKWEQQAEKFDSNQGLFPDFLHHQVALQVAHQIGSTGPLLAPMAACATGVWALATAYELIQTGQCQQVIAGAVEAPITPLTLAGFSQMGALAKTGAYPFDCRREGFVLAEGGALFVLESAELAQRRAAPIYGQILGLGLTADACSLNRPNLKGKSSINAINQALQRSDLSAHNIDYIHAHGTATRLNDQHEANLIQSLFPSTVAVSSTKGATGHTLGASGALGIAFSLMALKHQTLPPCVGLTDAEFPLNFVREARRATVQNTLCFSFGFGGQNAAIALGR